MMPSREKVGTPAGLDGFFHFRSSTIFGSAARISARMRTTVSSRQSFVAAVVFFFALAGMARTIPRHRMCTRFPGSRFILFAGLDVERVVAGVLSRALRGG